MPADNHKLSNDTRYDRSLQDANRLIGCDVGESSIVVFDSRDSSTRSIANQPEALAAFAVGLDSTCFVICEAIGGRESRLCCVGHLMMENRNGLAVAAALTRATSVAERELSP